MKLEISMTDTVWVKLTREGRLLLREHYIRLCEAAGSATITARELERNHQGEKDYYVFTMDDLMKIFGGWIQCPFQDGKMLFTKPE